MATNDKVTAKKTATKKAAAAGTAVAKKTAPKKAAGAKAEKKEEIVFSEHNIPTKNAVRTKAATVAAEPLFRIAAINYNHYSKFGRHIASGTARMVEHPEGSGNYRFGTVEGPMLGAHRAHHQLREHPAGAEFTQLYPADKYPKEYDGYIYATAANIPAITKNIQTFFKKYGEKANLKNMFTFFAKCEPLVKDKNVKAIVNDLVTE